MASPAPNVADRTSEMTTGDGPTPSSRTRPKNTVKHQRMSTRYIPLPNGRANAIAQHSDGHPKPIIHLPKRHRPPLEGERHIRATNGNAHSSSGQSTPQKLAATSNESDKLVTISIESENPDSGEIPQVRLGSVRRHADDANGPRDRADALEGQTDESRGWADTLSVPHSAETLVVSHRTGAGTYLSTGDAKRAVDETNGTESHADASSCHRDTLSVETDVLNASNNPETGGISNGEGVSTYLGTRDANRAVDETDGIGSHADTSTGHEDAHSVQTDVDTPTIAPETVSIHPIEAKPPDPPAGSTTSRSDATDGFGNHADRSSMHTDAQSGGNERGRAVNTPETVKICPLELKTPNSPPGSARERAEHPNGLRNRADTTSGPTDVQSVAHETETAANASKTVSTRPNIPKPPNSPSGDAKRDVDEMDGLGGHADASNGQADAPSVNMDTVRPANESKRVRMPPNGLKRPDSPVEAASQRSDEPNGCRDHTDASSAQMDALSVQTGASTPANGMERVRTRQHGSKTQDSPHGRGIATPKCTYQWKRVSVGDRDVYLPQNTLIDRTGQIFVFGQAESAGEAVVARVVDETDGRWNGGDGSVDGTTSGNSIDSTRANAALLAMESQRVHYSQRTRQGNLPVSSKPPIQSERRPYGPARRQGRHGKLKIERINDKSISQTPKRVKTTHLRCTRAAQPRGNPSKHFHRVYTPIRQRGRIKFAPTNVSPTQNGKTAHLGRDPIAQPRGDDPQRSYRVIGPRRRRGRLKMQSTSVSRKRKERNTYQGLHKPILPLPRDAGDPSRSTPIGYLLYSLQSLKDVLQKVSRDDNESIASNMHLSANGSTTRNASIADT